MRSRKKKSLFPEAVKMLEWQFQHLNMHDMAQATEVDTWLDIKVYFRTIYIL